MSEKSLGNLSLSDFWISPKYKASHWLKLNLNTNSNKNWSKAVRIFENRINGRFLNPVKVLDTNQDDDIWEFSGFTIMAIDCLLIETLNQFYNGLDETKGKHWKAFWKLFKVSPFFKSEFNIARKAEVFHSHFRCGILHQAQTKKKSKIRIDSPKMVQLVDQSDINEGLIINRKSFHDALKKEIDLYIKKLKNPKSKEDFNLRNNFKIKMNFIVGKI